MPLNSLVKSAIWSIGLIIVVGFSILQNSIASNDIEHNYNKIKEALGNIPQPDDNEGNEAYIGRVFQIFSKTLESDDKETQLLLNRWNKYLISASHFSNADHQEAIESQQIEYFNAISDLNKRIEETNNFRKEYSSSWVDDLLGKFGEEYVKKNRDAILDNFGAIIARSYHQYEKELQDLIYVETMLYGSYKDYFSMFLDFYNEKLDDHGRKKLMPREKAAVAFLELIQDVSFTHMHQTYVLRDKMEENRARKNNKDLFLFFREHPVSQNFDISKANNDLERAIQ